MSRFTFFLLALIITIQLTSCKKEAKVTLPFDEEKVINILGDMHFAKSAALIHKSEKRDSMRLIYDSQVYAIHGITEEEYKNLKITLESDLNLYNEIEKKVHQHLKSVQNEKNK